MGSWVVKDLAKLISVLAQSLSSPFSLVFAFISVSNIICKKVDQNFTMLSRDSTTLTKTRMFQFVQVGMYGNFPSKTHHMNMHGITLNTYTYINVQGRSTNFVAAGFCFTRQWLHSRYASACAVVGINLEIMSQIGEHHTF